MRERTGTLCYNFGDERYEIAFDNGDYNDRVSLHCGDCFTVLAGKKWVQTRIEYGQTASGEEWWYLVGCRDMTIAGARVRY